MGKNDGIRLVILLAVQISVRLKSFAHCEIVYVLSIRFMQGFNLSGVKTAVHMAKVYDLLGIWQTLVACIVLFHTADHQS